jgi:hypothetical protein
MSKRIKKRAKYQGVSLPVPLIEEIKKHIMHKKEYRGIADFIKQAIREKMNFSSAFDRIFDEAKHSDKILIMRPRGDGLYEPISKDRLDDNIKNQMKKRILKGDAEIESFDRK